uniref:Myb_DNA-bind_3 domain-containing protein n=1 Tax=Bursaphelenchus xylophilus TaxID=6326 RepID=A0A1I7SFN9_BURXY
MNFVSQSTESCRSWRSFLNVRGRLDLITNFDVFVFKSSKNKSCWKKCKTKVSGRQFFDDITDLVLKHPNEFRGTRYSFAKVAEELATKYGVEAGPDFRTRVAATWNNHRRYLMVLENKGRELTKREQWILNFKKGCNMEINESEARKTTRHSRKKIKKTTALMEAVASCSHLKKSNKAGGNSVFWTLVEQRFLERLPNCSRKGLRPKLQQILSGVTVRARKKVASGRKLKSDEKLALKVNGNGNCNSPKNSTANDQDDRSHARRSRRSATTIQNTSVTSLNYSDAFKFIVCNAVAKHPELFVAQRTRNFKLGKEIWKRIEEEIREGHPGPENLSAICQAWQRCKEHAFSHKKSGKMREIDKLVFDILSKNSPESLSRRLDTINRSVGQRDSNFLESLSTEMDTTVVSERSESSSGRPRRSCRSSVANYKDPVLELSSEDDEIDSAAPSAAVSRRSVTKNSQRIELASAEAVAPTSSVIREGGGSNAPRNDENSANNARQTPMPLTEKEPSQNLNSSTTSETAPISGSSTTEKVLREEGSNRALSAVKNRSISRPRPQSAS